MKLSDVISMFFEASSASVVIIAFYLAILVYKKYPQLTKVGWREILISLFLFAVHLVIDTIDTWVYDYESDKKVEVTFLGYTTKIRLIYTLMDLCENALAVVAIVLLTIGFMRLSGYLYSLWGKGG